MQAKEKAIELLNKFRTYPYKGESEEDDETKVSLHAKQNVLTALDVVNSFLPFTDLNTSLGKYCEKQRQIIEDIKAEIHKL